MSLVSVPEGQVLLSQPHPAPVRIGNAVSKQNWFDRPDSYAPLDVAFSADGGTLISCLRSRQSEDSLDIDRVDVWDSTVARLPARSVTTTAKGRFNSVCFNSDNQIIIGSDKGVTKSELADGTTTWTTPEANRFISEDGTRTRGGFDPTGEFFVQFLPNRVLLWESSTGRLVEQLESYVQGEFAALPGSEDLRWLLVKQLDEEGGDAIGIFRPQKRDRGNQTVIHLRDFGTPAPTVKVSDDGCFVAISKSYNSEGAIGVQIVRTADGRVVADMPPISESFEVLFAHKAARAMVKFGSLGSEDESLRVFDLDSGEQVAELRNPNFRNSQIDPSGKYALIAVSERNNEQRSAEHETYSLQLWRFDKPDTTPLVTADFENPPDCEFNPDGTTFVVKYSRGKKDMERTVRTSRNYGTRSRRSS